MSIRGVFWRGFCLHIEQAFDFVWFFSVWFLYFLGGLLFLRVLVFLLISESLFLCMYLIFEKVR